MNEEASWGSDMFKLVNISNESVVQVWAQTPMSTGTSLHKGKFFFHKNITVSKNPTPLKENFFTT